MSCAARPKRPLLANLRHYRTSRAR